MLKESGFIPIRATLAGLFIAVFLFLPRATLPTGYPEETEFLHQVAPGESLTKIARLYFPLTEEQTVGDLVERIQERNEIEGTLIHPDQRLLIPVVRSAPVVAKTIPKPRNFEAKGIYINRYSMACQKMTRLIDTLTLVGGNTVVLDAKDMSGRLSYPSKVPLAEAIGACDAASIVDPAKLFHALHQKGLHVCVRLVLFFDPFLAAKRPDLVIRSLATGEPWMENGKVTWVDPSNPIVQRYNLDLAKELAEMGADEIQFDYIRFPTNGNTRDAAYSFDEERIAKHEIITAFLAQAQKELAPHKLLLSIDVFGVMAWERPEDLRMTGQKIDDLADHCDVISPMIYPSHFYACFQGIARPGDQPFWLVSEAIRRFSHLLERKQVTLRPWIQAFPFGTSRFDEEYILEELRALSWSDTCGWLLWSAGNAYDVSWRALVAWNDVDSAQTTVGEQFSRLDPRLMQ